MRSTCVLAAALLACAIAMAPAGAQAAAANKDGKPSQVEQKDQGREKASQDAAAAKPPSDLESCRDDADGKKGPERSRFMTACIRDRK
jgi:hypothetical protein